MARIMSRPREAQAKSRPRRQMVIDPPIARAVAQWVTDNTKPGDDTLAALACTAGISLDVAMCGFVFRELWLKKGALQ
jgi:hypothetical protein